MEITFKDFIEENIAEREYALNEYQRDKDNKNNFSYWFKRIKNVSGFAIPESKIVPIPFDIWVLFHYDQVMNYSEYIEKYVNDKLVPVLLDNSPNRGYIYFVKNGRFSHKFSYNKCVTNVYRIKDSFIDICYAAECVGAGGNTEFVIRDYISYDQEKYATIYSGLPLRCEIRLSYDFDTHKVLYPVNYWDHDYVYNHLYAKTDKIIFSAERYSIQQAYDHCKDYICEQVENGFKDVELDGQWSIDIMIDESHNRSVPYLIDMAIAQNSAYWNENKIKNIEKEVA